MSGPRRVLVLQALRDLGGIASSAEIAERFHAIDPRLDWSRRSVLSDLEDLGEDELVRWVLLSDPGHPTQKRYRFELIDEAGAYVGRNTGRPVSVSV